MTNEQLAILLHNLKMRLAVEHERINYAMQMSNPSLDERNAAMKGLSYLQAELADQVSRLCGTSGRVFG